MDTGKKAILRAGLEDIAQEIPVERVEYIDYHGREDVLEGYGCRACSEDIPIIDEKPRPLKSDIKHDRKCPSVTIPTLIKKNNAAEYLNYLRKTVVNTLWDYEGGGVNACPHCHHDIESDAAMGQHYAWCPMKKAKTLLEKVGEELDLTNVQR